MRRWKPIWIPYGDNVQKSYCHHQGRTTSQTRKVWLVDVVTDGNASVTLLRFFSFLHLFFLLAFLVTFFQFFANNKKSFQKIHQKFKKQEKKKTQIQKQIEKSREKQKDASKEGIPFLSETGQKIDFVLTNMLQEIVQQLRLAKTNKYIIHKNTNIKQKKSKRNTLNPKGRTPSFGRLASVKSGSKRSRPPMFQHRNLDIAGTCWRSHELSDKDMFACLTRTDCGDGSESLCEPCCAAKPSYFDNVPVVLTNLRMTDGRHEVTHHQHHHVYDPRRNLLGSRIQMRMHQRALGFCGHMSSNSQTNWQRTCRWLLNQRTSQHRRNR